jgi:DNA-binding response OmpR family regulator
MGIGIWIDHQRYVWRDATKLGQLTDPTECNLLTYLIAHKHQVCSYSALYRVAYEKEDYLSNDLLNDKQIDESIQNIRQLVEGNPMQPKTIRRAVGIGYVLEE